MGQHDHEYTGPDAFLDFTAEVADGQFKADMSRELLALMFSCHERAVTENKVAKGKLTIELSFATDPRGNVLVNYGHKTKLPPRATANGQLWMGKHGPTAVHPKQLEVPGTERKRRGDAPPSTARRPEENPEHADDGDDSDGLH